ncbi:MAG: hypothetical protein Q4G07_07110 [Oscillospiraceae bacterium]|nr:hypothetical protein [Oscillospiraceae bacterium]
MTISQAGMEALAGKTAPQLQTMTKEDFMDIAKQWPPENQPQLETNPYWEVDPDGSIARKAYFESYLGQLMETESNVKSYYAGAYDEAVSAPIDSLAYISGKYLCSWSDYFDPSMPQTERQWTHHQLYALLTDSHVALNDPYALAAHGGPKTSAQMDKTAQQAVKDTLDALLRQREGL